MLVYLIYCLQRYRIHVIDLEPSSETSGGWLEDTSLVEKYTISEDAYSKLDGTYRKFKEKLVPQNQGSHNSNTITENYMEELCAVIEVGDYPERDPLEEDEI